MGEPKTFASLSSGLLARKGAARPAMRPQGFGQIGATLEDLGWNDMGFEPPKPTLSAVRDEDHDAFGEETPEPAIRHPLAGLTPASPVHNQQAELAERFAGYDVEAGDEDEEDSTAEPFEVEMTAVAAEVDEGAPEAGEAALTLPVAPAPRLPRVTPTHRAPVQRAAPGSKGKAAFTLRLDPSRHLKLRLACAVTGRSAQMLVTDALDQLLGAMPELDGMAAKAPSARKAH
ncbi:MAG: hypothetical protein ABR588_09100 [Sphingomicrobium sp.]